MSKIEAVDVDVAIAEEDEGAEDTDAETEKRSEDGREASKTETRACTTSEVRIRDVMSRPRGCKCLRVERLATELIRSSGPMPADILR